MSSIHCRRQSLHSYTTGILSKPPNTAVVLRQVPDKDSPASNIKNEEKDHYEIETSPASDRESVWKKTPKKERFYNDTSEDSSVSTDRSVGKSQYLSRQLEEVRQGIFRLLSDGDEDKIADSPEGEEKKADNQLIEGNVNKTSYSRSEDTQQLYDWGPGYQADGEIDQSEEESSSHSLVLDSGREDHVVEKQELEVCEKEMGCMSGENREGDERGVDSGIERGVCSSRGGSAEGWLARLNNRIPGRSRVLLGSGGQSSDSEASITQGRRMSIDREGGFSEGNLEQRVRELWVRLAQMEAEKFRAVEEAIEEGRRLETEALQKEKILLERDKHELLKAKEQMKKDKEAMDQKMRSIVEGQKRDADLVNRLQVR